jgi:hypothetical protein
VHSAEGAIDQPLDDGAMIEVGMIGKEGFIGVPYCSVPTACRDGRDGNSIGGRFGQMMGRYSLRPYRRRR